MPIYNSLNPLPSDRTSFMLEDVDVINASIYNILFTYPGTDMFRPDFGIGIQSWLFSSFNDQIKVMRINEIRQSLKRWEPRIKVGNITFNLSDGVADISIQYSFSSNLLSNLGTFKFSLQVFKGSN